MTLKKMEEVMKETGLTRKALRHYDERGLLRATKIPTGKNLAWYYTEEDVTKLGMIKLYRDLDIPLQRIDELINGAGEDREEERDKIMNEVLTAMMERIHQVEHQVEIVRNIKSFGIEGAAKESKRK